MNDHEIACFAKHSKREQLGLPYRRENGKRVPATVEEAEERIQAFRNIVENRSCRRIVWRDHENKRRSVLVDVVSATAVVQAFDALKVESSKLLLMSYDPVTVVRVSWSLFRSYS